MSEEAPGAVPYPRRPWLTIWTRPRETMRAIADSDPSRHVLWLVILTGFFNGLSPAAGGEMGDSLDLGTILLIAVGAAMVGGLMWFYVLSWFAHWVGLWFGGKASAQQLRAAMAWPSLIWIALGVVWIPELLIYGRQLFTSEPVSAALYGVLWANFLLSVVALLGFTSLVIICVSEVQRFSPWRAFASVGLTLLLIVAPIQLLYWLFSGRTL